MIGRHLGKRGRGARRYFLFCQINTWNAPSKYLTWHHTKSFPFSIWQHFNALKTQSFLSIAMKTLPLCVCKHREWKVCLVRLFYIYSKMLICSELLGGSFRCWFLLNNLVAQSTVKASGGNSQEWTRRLPMGFLTASQYRVHSECW